ncbi:MAG: nitrous oxide reductase accessory protein NosL [Gammaproteobacteria bacterium]|nr:nitrous oxide reductase accessory protein NosL [Gammaproteobacteria bacterium]MDH5594315.1 nitrous oxide reductase accessory protein NosL [Gammaproteobacteria bacterium]
MKLQRTHRDKILLIVISIMLAGCSSDDQDPIVSNPLDLTRHDVCFVDGMLLMEHAGPKAQIITRKGEVRHYCDTREFFSVLLEPEGTTQIRFSYVQDFSGLVWGSYNSHWINAASAWYVFGSRQYGAMGPTIIPFGDRRAAMAFVKKQGGTVFGYNEITPSVLEQFFKKTRDEMRNMEQHNHQPHDHAM